MPNHVTTRLKMSGSPEQISTFVGKHIATREHGMRCFDFQSVAPIPEILKSTTNPNRGTEEAKHALEQTGYANWYDWAIAVWGTKWNAFHFSEEPHLPGDTEYECSFDTAWSYPQALFERLEDMYPDLKMEVAFFDECQNFAGYGVASDPTYCEATDELYYEVYGIDADAEAAFDQDAQAESDMENEMD